MSVPTVLRRTNWISRKFDDGTWLVSFSHYKLAPEVVTPILGRICHPMLVSPMGFEPMTP